MNVHSGHFDAGASLARLLLGLASDCLGAGAGPRSCSVVGR